MVDNFRGLGYNTTMEKGTFQDDSRERAMRDLFNLYKDEKNEGRSGTDAFLDIDDITIPFELKTTSTGSVTTVRDFGPDHIAKWQNKHWLIGFFIHGRVFYKYGSPALMAPWIKEKEEYISLDFQMADLAAAKLTLEDLYRLLGQKSVYTLVDAKSLHKKQYSKSKYFSLQDCSGGYSPQQMLKILKDRMRYIHSRGSTLNNPQIPLGYFKHWPKIEINHAETLRCAVKNSLKDVVKPKSPIMTPSDIARSLFDF